MKSGFVSLMQSELRLAAAGATASAFSTVTLPVSHWDSQFWSWSWPRNSLWDRVSKWAKRWR